MRSRRISAAAAPAGGRLPAFAIQGEPIMMSAEKRRFCAVLLTTLWVAWTGSASAGTLERIRHDKAIRLAYREDAPPFSYNDSSGMPAGFMVDLCDAVAKKLTQQLQLPALSVIYVPVTAVNRFEAIEQNKADLLCEPTSATLTRRALVDF